jgi:ElaB/YqjD/DUF883 family membrane-anchored ribosome-binding protein
MEFRVLTLFRSVTYCGSIAEHEESKTVIQKLQAELTRNKRDDLLRSWQDEAKRNSENYQGKIESLEQEISHLKHASKEFGAKVSSHRRRVMRCFSSDYSDRCRSPALCLKTAGFWKSCATRGATTLGPPARQTSAAWKPGSCLPTPQ